MRAQKSTGNILNPSQLCIGALLAAGWVVFLSLIPDFLMRIFNVDSPIVSAITWGGGVIFDICFYGVSVHQGPQNSVDYISCDCRHFYSIHFPVP